MTKIYLLVDENKEVVAAYSNEDLAKKMTPVIEEKLSIKLTMVIKRLNPDIKVVGIY